MLRKAVTAVTLIAAAAAQSPAYGQCGGQGWNGATTCVAGYTCIVSNPYYSQCLPGSAPPTTTPPSGGGGTGTGTPTTTTTAAGSTSTLLPGNLWIRAVEDPNFHHYLQSSTSGTASTAVFGSYLTAAQFQLNGGQVEQQLADGTVLYLTVLPSSNASATYLGTTFTAVPNGWGAFSFSGDGLNWTADNVTRSNTGAFLACGGGSAPTVNINLGPYGYMTPAGCADETLNYYNGATAND